MDQTTLRLILLALGSLLVAGIYVWDKYGRRIRNRSRFAQHKKSRQADPPISAKSPVEAATQEQPVGKIRDEPYIGDTPTAAGLTASQAAIDTPTIDLDNIQQSQLALDLADDTGFALQHDLPETAPRLILQLHVVARSTPFDAACINQAAMAVGLQYGTMQIYHRDSDIPDNPLFSVASMLEPGTLPDADDTEFTTPGLTLFTELPGVHDNATIYTEMLFTAQRLTDLLQADLQDETHSILTKQAIEHTRDQILEHQRQIDLLRIHHASP